MNILKTTICVVGFCVFVAAVWSVVFWTLIRIIQSVEGW
jgi:hypothetical protein